MLTGNRCSIGKTWVHKKFTDMWKAVSGKVDGKRNLIR